MYQYLRNLLFLLEPETAHRFTLNVLDMVPRVFFPKSELSPLTRMGLRFAHPLGLAAGLDKNADHLKGLGKLGFSFIEVGTVTPKPQSGNPAPRLFRLPEDEALINRMGFNNDGVETLIHNVAQRSRSAVLGINIGKNRDTSLENAADDYCTALGKVYLCADYVTVNISSPNTPDLRRLQEAHFFENLLNRILDERDRQADKHQRWVPLAVKISPDERDEQLKRLAEIVLDKKIEGMIATNTTAAREGLRNTQYQKETGGLSGRPLRDRANHCMQQLKAQTGNAVTLIGVGGIDSPEAAQERLAAGADLLQIYTGLIYQGPGLISRIVRSLSTSCSE